MVVDVDVAAGRPVVSEPLTAWLEDDPAVAGSVSLERPERVEVHRARRWSRIGQAVRLRFVATVSMPAAGRYSRSPYSWSIRAVEKRQIVVAIELRITLRSSAREAVGVALVVGRHELLLEDPVQVLRVGPVLGALVGVRVAAADGPAVVAGPALVPPAVEHATVDDAVRGRLHAAACPTPRAGGAGC